MFSRVEIVLIIIAPRMAVHQKFSMFSFMKVFWESLAVHQSMVAFMIRVNSPRVRQVMGRASIFIMGFSIVLIMPNIRPKNR